MDVNKVVEIVNTIPMLRLINDFVEVPIADPDPDKFSVIISDITFFLFQDLYFLL